MSNLLLIPSGLFFILVIVFSSEWFYFIFSNSVKVLIVPLLFLYSSPKFGEYPYKYYFEFFISKVTYLHFIKIYFHVYLLFFNLEYIYLSPHFV